MTARILYRIVRYVENIAWAIACRLTLWRGDLGRRLRVPEEIDAPTGGRRDA